MLCVMNICIRINFNPDDSNLKLFNMLIDNGADILYTDSKGNCVKSYFSHLEANKSLLNYI